MVMIFVVRANENPNHSSTQCVCEINDPYVCKNEWIAYVNTRRFWAQKIDGQGILQFFFFF